MPREFPGLLSCHTPIPVHPQSLRSLFIHSLLKLQDASSLSMASNNTDVYVPCTLQTCPISEAPIPYQPRNAASLAIFASALVIQLGFGLFYRTWSYLIGIGGGLVLEIAGYSGRIQLHANPFVFNSFVQ